MKSKVLEITLEQVRLDMPRGVPRGGRRLLLVSLVWPRPLIAERSCIKVLDFAEGVADLRACSWTERVLFKEKIAGRFGIQAGITALVPDRRLAALMDSLMSAVLKTAGDQAADLASTAFGAGFLRLPFQYMSAAGKGTGGENPQPVARGDVDMDSDACYQGKTVAVRIPLAAPEAITEVTRVPEGGEMTTRRRRVAAAGGLVGEVRMQGRVYEADV